MNDSRQVERVRTACGDSLLDRHNRPTLCFWGGLLAGALIGVFSFAAGFLATGRLFNDPMYLILGIIGVFQGFLYFKWAAFGMALLSSMLTGVAAWLGVWIPARVAGKRVLGAGARKAATVAVLVSVIPVLFVEIDSIQLVFWYGFAILISNYIAGIAARGVVQIAELLFQISNSCPR